MSNKWQAMPLSTKILGGLLLLTIIGWSATTIYANLSDRLNQTYVEEMETNAHITVVQAKEMGRTFIGGGDVIDIQLYYHDDEAIFDVIINYLDADFQVILNAQTGDLIQITTLSAPERNEIDLSVNENIAPSSPIASPESTPAQSSPTPAPSSEPTPVTPHDASISREAAGEIALGISGGRLIEVSRSRHRTLPAWWVETRAGGMVHEFYIDMETGAVLQHEIERDD